VPSLLLTKRGPGSLYRRSKSIEYLLTRDRTSVRRFLLSRELSSVGLGERIGLLRRLVRATNALRGYHTLSEMLEIATAILARKGREPIVVEAGCGYGASTAKLSLAVRLASGRLIACDSYRGIPRNDEQHELVDGRRTRFFKGAFRGTLASVTRAVGEWGAPDVCRFEKGWFQETLPRLRDPLDVVVLDVDLVASTRCCLRELWPRLREGGVLFSLDGQLRATHEVFGDETFWRESVGFERPEVSGLGESKLLTVRKRGSEGRD
jgi:O-methyltransferase